MKIRSVIVPTIINIVHLIKKTDLKSIRKRSKRLYINNLEVYLHPLSEKKVHFFINKLIKTLRYVRNCRDSRASIQS